MKNYKPYTGVGSRKTPTKIQLFMEDIAEYLLENGYTLRSGRAPGADQAFERGVESFFFNNSETEIVPAEIYLPWKSFEENSRRNIVPARTTPQKEAFLIAEHYHPGWKFLTQGAKNLHARNVHQVLGEDVTNPSPSLFLICWTPKDKLGGTGQAIRIARDYGVKILNLNESDSYLIDAHRFLNKL